MKRTPGMRASTWSFDPMVVAAGMAALSVSMSSGTESRPLVDGETLQPPCTLVDPPQPADPPSVSEPPPLPPLAPSRTVDDARPAAPPRDGILYTFLEGTDLPSLARDGDALVFTRGVERTTLDGTPLKNTAVADDNGPSFIAWGGGRALVETTQYDEGCYTPTFEVRGATDVAAPDFHGLIAQGWCAQPYPGVDRSLVAAAPTGEVFVFGDARRGTGQVASNEAPTTGIFRWSSRTGARFYPVPGTQGYFYPKAIVARSGSDAFAGAATFVGSFGDDFPGCPSIVQAALNSGWLAHFDGAAWSQIRYPAKGRLWSMSLDADGTLRIVAGLPRDQNVFGHVGAGGVEQWVLPVNGAWKRLPLPEDARALEAGWKIEREQLMVRGADGAWKKVAMPRPIGAPKARYVPVAITVARYDDVWVDADVTGDETYGGSVRAWLRTGGGGETMRFTATGEIVPWSAPEAASP